MVLSDLVQNCQKSVSTNSHKQGAIQKNIAQHPPRRRGRPKKIQIPKSPSPTQKSQELVGENSSQDKNQDLYGVLIEIKNELGEVNPVMMIYVMNTKMSDFKQSLGIEINSVKENVGKNTVVLTHLQVDFEEQLRSSVGIKTDVELNKKVLTGLKVDVSQNKVDAEQSRSILSNVKVSQEDTQNKAENLDGK